MLWHLYGERRTFIDGRNFDPQLYRDFLICQTGEQGRRRVDQKYDLDAYLLPPIEKSDAGLERIHRSLATDDAWSLCYLDRHAWIYVRNGSVDPAWLASNGMRVYHPLTLHNRRLNEDEIASVRADLERAVTVSPEYYRTRFDLALVYMTVRDRAGAMREVEKVLEIDPGNRAALDLRERLRSGGE
jgi:hypothetical protein